ncbi:MAG TPA: DUF6502 family protein [Burkholderiaceae bacterium]|nr:DUF6502 family protein [Burkholderiaceae bacterium]
MDESRSEIALREALRLMQPLAHVLVTNGVTYPQFVRALKTTFLRAALAELRAADAPVTDSALSLLSGVHRKDVRVMRTSDGPPPSRNRALSLAADVAARWTRAPEYLDAQGAPRALPLRSRSPNENSFESLVQSVSKDFHARSVLDELLRLEAAVVEHEHVRLRVEGLGSSDRFAALAGTFAANAGDHISAGAANLRAAGRADPPPFFDQAIAIDGLSVHSTSVLQNLAREACAAALARVEAEGGTRHAQEAHGLPQECAMRVRVGTFFYAEPIQVAPPAKTPAGGTRGTGKVSTGPAHSEEQFDAATTK